MQIRSGSCLTGCDISPVEKRGGKQIRNFDSYKTGREKEKIEGHRWRKEEEDQR